MVQCDYLNSHLYAIMNFKSAEEVIFYRNLNERLDRIEKQLNELMAAKPRRISSQQSDAYLEAMTANKHKLKGKMLTDEIVQAIGMTVSRSDRVAFGQALTMYGAIKGKSGSVRYYVFE